ncbi:MAG: glycyl-tRNA synthetase beta chain [Alphaproteobacteria bacterium]|jgi:glycyl-tRNA synthetase beta chain
MAELLIELLSEEIPAGLQVPAADQLRRLVVEALKEAEIEFTDAKTHSASRRLVLAVDGLPTVQADRAIERKGPRTNAPEQAIQGFLGAAGVTLDACEVREDKKGAFYVAVIEQQGQPVKDILADIVRDAVAKFSWPKSMRWTESRFRWVRPLHNVLAIFDGSPLAGGIDLDKGDLAFSDQTYGHRFLAPGAIQVKDHNGYVQQLAQAFVAIDRDHRRGTIADSLDQAAQALGLAVRDDPALLEEVTGLVEWPVVLTGDIDPQFMDLPAEVLTTSMRSHQKYFALEQPDGALASKFAFVANMAADDGGAAIVAGNQRVLRARLADAQHFWDQDRKKTLQSRVPELSNIIFHAKLGSVGDKIDRMTALAIEIATNVPSTDKDRVRSAARLAKADLVTGMVGEFPELQGIMGQYYALAEGETADVAAAIAEHYSPAGPTDTCPSAPTSIAVAMADKIDTLVGFWKIDEKPTGSKDPYALRRAALGVIRIVLENRLRLSLREAFATAGGLLKVDDTTIYDDLMSFIADRLKVHLRDEGISHDHIEAIFALSGEDDLVRLLERVRALAAFVASEDGANLLIAYRRAANIVRAEQKKDDAVFDGGAYDASLAEGVEAALWTALEGVETKVSSFLEDEKFADAMSSLAQLREPVDKFFDDVTVNVDDTDIRRNRLRLLAHIQQVMDNVADFSKIEG